MLRRSTCPNPSGLQLQRREQEAIVDSIKGGCERREGRRLHEGRHGLPVLRSLVAQLIDAYRDAGTVDASEHYYVPGVPLEKSVLVAEIRRLGIKSVSGVFQKLAGARKTRPARST
jgi:nitrite reductase (NADH) large subunit